MGWLSVVWWASAVTGVAGVIAAVARKPHRRTALWVATAGVVVAGVLGLASIGIFLLVGAGVCAVAAIGVEPRGGPAPERASTGRPAET